MADGSKIEWTDATWNPITGCSVVSPGCTNCYAMKLAGTRLKHNHSRIGLTDITNSGPVWNGTVRFNEQWLKQPIHWRKPRMIFVCAHGDLFHENVPDEWIDQVFAVMAIAQQHTFQVLTKRPKRMFEYLKLRCAGGRHIWTAGQKIKLPKRQHKPDPGWPLPNVQLGTSVEDQPRANERIRWLLQTPATVIWLSIEPMLGPVDLEDVIVNEGPGWEDFQNCLSLEEWSGTPDAPEVLNSVGSGRLIDWVVVGGESQKGARPMQREWARSIRDQCDRSGVPFHFKQWGEYAPNWYNDDDGNEIPGSMWMDRVGKKSAGRLLDGVEHNGFPTLLHGGR